MSTFIGTIDEVKYRHDEYYAQWERLRKSERAAWSKALNHVGPTTVARWERAAARLAAHESSFNTGGYR